jgi:xylan 1,4-beta-xylosidase
VRQQIDHSTKPGLPLYFTEWSTSYTPRDPVHDSYVSAAYVLSKLKGSEGMAQGMSYWTFSDLFEEPGPPTAPFQGGFGLMNPQGIRKPAYKYLNRLDATELKTSDDQSIVTWNDGVLKALLWDFVQPKQDKSNRPFYTEVFPAHSTGNISLELRHMHPGRYRVALYRTGFDANDAYTAYLRMGAPTSLNTVQLKKLQSLTADTATQQWLDIKANGSGSFSIPMRSNDVVLVEITRYD